MTDINEILQELSVEHGEIIIDTASLMEDARLVNMVEKYKPILLKNRQPIIIPGVVCQELVRHLTSDNTDKKRKANEALKIIRNFGEIFTVEAAQSIRQMRCEKHLPIRRFY